MLLRNAFALLNRLLPTEEAFAHCDIPCGIYDPHLMQLAALSVVRMNQLINDLAPPASMEKADRDKYMHALVRYTQVKEEHAEIVKREARIIRGDFFKPDNSPPNLGELTDGIMKTASKATEPDAAVRRGFLEGERCRDEAAALKPGRGRGVRGTRELVRCIETLFDRARRRDSRHVSTRREM